jgi:PIN domain nuclease of toxin-antitoxin system
VLWLLAGDRRVEHLRSTIEHPRATVLVSAVSIWEAAIKRGLGKLEVPEDLPERLDEFAFERLPVLQSHAWAVRSLPPVHADPFDRLLIAQAMCEDAAIISSDEILDRYGVRRVW